MDTDGNFEYIWLWFLGNFYWLMYKKKIILMFLKSSSLNKCVSFKISDNEISESVYILAILYKLQS